MKTDPELRLRVKAMLEQLWDPHAAAGRAAVRDAYDEYLPRVVALVQAGGSAARIADYLASVERDRLGLEPELARAQRVARLLARLGGTWRAGG
jgi:hypothetical protein